MDVFYVWYVFMIYYLESLESLSMTGDTSYSFNRIRILFLKDLTMEDEGALVRGVWLIAQPSRDKQIDEKIFNKYEKSN